MATFGENLKSIRLSRGMSQEEFAKLLGTSKQVISRYETDQRSPKISVAAKIADTLGVSLSMLNGEDESSEKEALDVWEIREQLRNNPELQILFRASHNATAEDLLEAAELIKARKTIRNITNRK